MAVERCPGELRVGCRPVEKYSITLGVGCPRSTFSSCSKSTQGTFHQHAGFSGKLPCAVTLEKVWCQICNKASLQEGAWESSRVVYLKCISQDLISAL